MAGKLYLGYTAGPAKSSDNAFFESDAGGGHIFIGYLTEYNIAFEHGIIGISETKPNKDEYLLGGLTFSTLAHIPIDQVSVFARAGVCRCGILINEIEQDSGTYPTYGFGADLLLGTNWGLRLEWQRIMNVGATEFEVDTTRFGVKYSF